MRLAYLRVKVGMRIWAAKWNQTILLAICTLLGCDRRVNQQILVFLSLVKREQRGHEASKSERFAVVINRYEVYDYISRCVCNLIFCYRKSEPVLIQVTQSNMLNGCFFDSLFGDPVS